MAKNLQAIRGMNDLLPGESARWRYIERVLEDTLVSYNYSLIRTPIVEPTGLFKRSIGDATDIVEKEMYTFDDRNGDSLSLRPEGTASTVRAGIQHGLFHNQQQRLYYMGPMFRHERPQKGRYRQFHQFGVETFGMEGPDVDVELLLITKAIWDKLGLADSMTLQINTLGSAESRAAYREAFVAYLEPYLEELDEDSKRRITTNPLRIWDSKAPRTQEILQDAPRLETYLDEESRNDFARFREMLDALNISYEWNQGLVRGLDYYNKVVFEWVTDRLGAQGTVCAGGRYDGLVEQLGGRAAVAAGFAIGLERLVLLCEETSLPDSTDSLYVASDCEDLNAALRLSEHLRTLFPSVRIQTHMGNAKLKKVMQRADKMQASFCLFVGQMEHEASTCLVKDLRNGDQQKLSLDALTDFLGSQILAG